MSDKVIVSKQDANDLPYVEQEHSGDKYVLLDDIKHWLKDATPVSGEAVFAEYYDEENEEWEKIAIKDVGAYSHAMYRIRMLYTTPQPAPDTVPREKFNKLVWALKHVKPSTRSVDPNAWDTIEKALAEAKGE